MEVVQCPVHGHAREPWHSPLLLIFRELDFPVTSESCRSISTPDCEPGEWYAKPAFNSKDTIKCRMENFHKKTSQWCSWKLESQKERILFSVNTDPPNMLAKNPHQSIFLCSWVPTASFIFLLEITSATHLTMIFPGSGRQPGCRLCSLTNGSTPSTAPLGARTLSLSRHSAMHQTNCLKIYFSSCHSMFESL